MAKSIILGKEFYLRPAPTVARDLLGKFLVVQRGSRGIASMITEVEAYAGPHDLACHASKGLTPRTRVMFEPGGVWYVYFIYGMYEMLNIVTGEKDYPAAVLIRGVADAKGPGRLTKYFGITQKFNCLTATRKTGLWIEDRGAIIDSKKIKKSPRIGVDYAGTEWAGKHYRFFLQ